MSFAERVTDRRNQTIYGPAILLAIAAAYGFSALLDSSGSFLALALVGIIVPVVYDRHGPDHDSPRETVTWIVATAAVAFAIYVALYLGFTALSLAPGFASAAAFLVVGLGGTVAVTSRHD